MQHSSRPQTLKQARRAYQRKGGPTRLSASELAQAERRAALQERANRIKEREARRKANLKKRDEKIAREREAARQKGKPFLEDQKPRLKIGASQLSLGGFFNGVKKLDNSSHKKSLLAKEEAREDTENVAPQKQVELHGPLTLHNPPQLASVHCCIDEPVFALPRRDSPVSSARQMPPPPIPQPPKQLEMLGEAFEGCFPSNTQIQRELSPEPSYLMTDSTSNTPQSPSRSNIKNVPALDAAEINELLACISTQDLNLSSTPTTVATKNDDLDLLAQVSTQDLDFGDSSAKSTAEIISVDPEFLIGQISTQDLSYSQESAARTTNTNIPDAECFADVDIESFVMDCEIDEYESAYVDSRAIC